MKIVVIPIVINGLGTVPKCLVRTMEMLEVGGRAETIKLQYVEIGQNTEKSPGDKRRLAVTQTPLKDYQLTLARKLAKK